MTPHNFTILNPCVQNYYDFTSTTFSQGAQTRGPPTVFLRLALLSKFKKYLIFQPKIGAFVLSDNKCGPQSHFFLNLWPSSAFEFETPALECRQ
jgi:hypothetical protein